MGSNSNMVVMSAVLILALAGCSMFDGGSGKPAKVSSAAVGSMRDTSAQLGRCDAALSRSTTALDALPSADDLPAAFKEFVNASDALQRTGEVAKSRWQDMRTRGDNYIQSWQKEISQVTDPQLRESMEARKELLKQNYEKIAETARAVRAAYEPYARTLNEIEKALRMDLTPAGVTVVQPMLERAAGDADVLKTKLADLRRQLNEVMGEMPAAQ